ncbi:MAG: class I SAM-dependent methyltransferase [Candidatus Marinimicrobia bacterium]|nr:class I SAM-dependent methyltransferase [Candidatus Neomarinimicrobiota bacterium]
MVDETKEVALKPEGYIELGEHAFKKRNLEDYKIMVFRDSSNFRDSSKRWLRKKPREMTPNNPMNWSTRHFHKIEHFLPGEEGKDPDVSYDWDWPERNIFGGFSGFFKRNVTILDLGSGFGQVVEEINEKYSGKGITCIGVDYRYLTGEEHADSDKLVGADFKDLPFNSDSFDRILSVESFPAWLPKRENVSKYFEEITRVSKEGTIWRGTMPIWSYGESKTPMSYHELVHFFTKNGWELMVDFRSTSFAARLSKK